VRIKIIKPINYLYEGSQNLSNNIRRAKKGKCLSRFDISAIILPLLFRARFRFSSIFFRYADDAHRRIVQAISFHLTILYYYVSSDTVIVAANRRVRGNRKENRWRNRRERLREAQQFDLRRLITAI